MIENKTGTSVIQLRYNKLGSYFWMDRPLALSWYDNSGSVGKYLCLFPWSKKYREMFFHNFQKSLYFVLVIPI